MNARSILLIGATGVFGGRLARGLARVEGVCLTLASRDAGRAERFASRVLGEAPGARVTATAFDNPRDLPRLAEIAPWLVIDASGPFQRGDYELARASLEAGAHYLDLADARAHVLGFEAALDPLARERGLVALAGASSTPALSSAVVDALTEGWTRVDAIDAAIAPGGASEVGAAVIEAILSRVGRAAPIWRAGRLQSVRGWGSLERRVMPGLGRRFVSPVETADAELLSRRFAVRDRVRFYAGLESRVEQFGLFALSRLLAPPTRSPGLARCLRGARRFTRLTCGDRGAMCVRVAGLDAAGAPARAQWSLLAERNDGLYVPTLPALAAVRALQAGRIAPGARPCVGVVDLAAIEAEMPGHAITTAREVSATEAPELFRATLGDESYAALPASLRAFHDRAGETVWSGRADVDAGAGGIARIARLLFGLPPTRSDAPIIVSVARDAGCESWVREFGAHKFKSRLRQSAPGRLEERFGPFAFDLALDARGRSVSMPISGWRFLGIPLPRGLAPTSHSSEFEDADGRYRFDVKLSLPVGGLLSHYRGWLAASASDGSANAERSASEYGEK